MPLAETGHTPLQRAQSEPRPQSESPALPAVLNRTRSSEVLPTPDYRISAEGSIHPDDEVLWTGVIQKTGDKTIRKRYRDRYFVLESGGCLHYWALTSNNEANKNMIESTAFELWQREDMISLAIPFLFFSIPLSFVLIDIAIPVLFIVIPLL